MMSATGTLARCGTNVSVGTSSSISSAKVRLHVWRNWSVMLTELSSRSCKLRMQCVHKQLDKQRQKRRSATQKMACFISQGHEPPLSMPTTQKRPAQ